MRLTTSLKSQSDKYLILFNLQSETIKMGNHYKYPSQIFLLSHKFGLHCVVLPFVLPDWNI